MFAASAAPASAVTAPVCGGRLSNWESVGVGDAFSGGISGYPLTVAVTAGKATVTTSRLPGVKATLATVELGPGTAGGLYLTWKGDGLATAQGMAYPVCAGGETRVTSATFVAMTGDLTYRAIVTRSL